MLRALISFTLLTTLLPSVRTQCLSSNDDLSIAEDVDLLAIQDFNLELFKTLIPKDPAKNFVFSPYSVWNSLVLAYFGSAGETEKQFRRVLRVPDKVSTLRKWRELEYLYMMRKDTSVNNTFVLSNRAYFDETVGLRTCMQDILHNELRQLDFINDAKNASKAINKFVSETTRGHINHLVSPMDVMFAYLVLVNAAFFKGTWTYQFEKKNTKERPFKTFDKQIIDVPMMNQFGNFRFGFDETHEFDVLELPYVGETIAMYIFLPYTDTLENFNGMINSFTSESVEYLVNNMWETKLHVYVPKFSLDTVVEDELLQAIYKMGLRDAFISYRANFTDFSYNRNIKLDRGIHKAFIDVNEEGTEAGAATALIANKIGGNSLFICNKPFVFFIRDNQTKNILFAGAYKFPKIEDEPKKPFDFSASTFGRRVYRFKG